MDIFNGHPKTREWPSPGTFLIRAEKFGSEEGPVDIFNGHPKTREWPDSVDLFNPSREIRKRGMPS